MDLPSNHPAGLRTVPQFRNARDAAAKAEITLRAFRNHVKKNVGGLQPTQQKVAGLGVLYIESKLQKHREMCAALKRKPIQDRKPAPEK